MKSAILPLIILLTTVSFGQGPVPMLWPTKMIESTYLENLETGAISNVERRPGRRNITIKMTQEKIDGVEVLHFVGGRMKHQDRDDDMPEAYIPLLDQPVLLTALVESVDALRKLPPETDETKTLYTTSGTSKKGFVASLTLSKKRKYLEIIFEDKTVFELEKPAIEQFLSNLKRVKYIPPKQ